MARGARAGSPSPHRVLLDLEGWGGIALEHAVEVEQLLAHLGERRAFGARALLACRSRAVAQAALGAFDGVALGIEEVADLEQRLDVLAAVEAMRSEERRVGKGGSRCWA